MNKEKYFFTMNKENKTAIRWTKKTKKLYYDEQRKQKNCITMNKENKTGIQKMRIVMKIEQ